MNIGAALGWVLDGRDRRAFFAKLCTQDVGFRAEGKDSSCWLWRFTLEPLRGDMDAPTGTAVQLAALLGIPFARLRASLPDELVAWDFAAAVGRKHIFSRSGFDASLEVHRQLSPELFATASRRIRMSAGKAASVDVDAAAELHAAATDDDILLEEFVGALPPGIDADACGSAPRVQGLTRPHAAALFSFDTRRC
jgi:hypothetical protein